MHKFVITLFALFYCQFVFANNQVYSPFIKNEGIFGSQQQDSDKQGSDKQDSEKQSIQISLYGMTNMLGYQKKVNLFNQARDDFGNLHGYFNSIVPPHKIKISEILELVDKVNQSYKSLYALKGKHLFFDTKAGVNVVFPSTDSSWGFSIGSHVIANEKLELDLNDIFLAKDWLLGKKINGSQMKSGDVTRGMIVSELALNYSRKVSLPFINYIEWNVSPKLQQIDAYKRTVNIFNYADGDYYASQYFRHKTTANIDMSVNKQFKYINIGFNGNNLIPQRIANISNEVYQLTPNYQLALMGNYSDFTLSSNIDLHKNNTFVDKKGIHNLLTSSQWIKTNIEYHMAYLNILAGYEKDITHHHFDNYNAGIGLLWPKTMTIHVAFQWNKVKEKHMGIGMQFYI